MRTIATTIALALALTGCNPPEAEPETAHERFTLETTTLIIQVEGDKAAIDQHGPQLLTRIEAVDPLLIRPGIGLWVEPEDTAPHLPGTPKLQRVGTVLAVERRVGGY